MSKAKELLQEAVLQIRYLHEKFGETGSGNSVASRIESYLEEIDLPDWKEALEKEATDRTAPSHPFFYVNKTKRQIFIDSAEWAKQWIENNVPNTH